MDITRDQRWNQKVRCTITTLGQIERERIEEERRKERKIEQAVNKAGLKVQVEFLTREFSDTDFLECLQKDVFSVWEKRPNRTAIFAYCDILPIAERYGLRERVEEIKDKMIDEARVAMEKKRKRIEIVIEMITQG